MERLKVKKLGIAMKTKNEKLSKILSFLSERPKPVEIYAPKFIIGDVILNKYVVDGRSMDLICLVTGMNRDENDLACRAACYTLKTLFNNGVKQKVYSRQASVRSIDAFYNIIKPEVASVLYSIELNSKQTIKKPKVKGE